MDFAHCQSMVTPVLDTMVEPHPCDADAALVARMLRRERTAWRRFHEVHAPSMLATVRITAQRRQVALCGADLEDVHAMVLAGLVKNDMQKLTTFDPSRRVRLSTWLCVLTRNATLDYLRWLRRAPRSAGPAAFDLLAAEQELPCDRLANRADRAALPDWFHGLGPRDQVFVQLLLAGHSYREIAGRMGVTLGTVYSKTCKLGARIRANRTAIAAHVE